MIAFLLFLIGIAFHLGALFFAFGVGVEAERVGGNVDGKQVVGVYIIMVFILGMVGVVLTMASTRVM